MEYRSVSDLNEIIFNNGYKFPPDADLVVGIPRSGMLAANLVALHLNLPLLDLESFLYGIPAEVGRTAQSTIKCDEHPVEKVLVVDDSILTGLSMSGVRERIERAAPAAQFCYCAIYGAKRYHPEVDLILETVEHPRIFQWNLMRHCRLGDACFDIDGVLCHDPSPLENDDGQRYLDFLMNARPLMQPRAKIQHLVTSRLEKYRPETERWLAQHGISYGKLWMLGMASGEERRRQNAHAAYKAAIYVKTGAGLFVESDERQAVRIAQLSGRPVLSVEGQHMVWPMDNPEEARRRYRKESKKGSNSYNSSPVRAFSVRLLRKFLGDAAVCRIKMIMGSKLASITCLPLLLV